MEVIAYALGITAAKLTDPLAIVAACIVVLITMTGRYLWMVPIIAFVGSMANIWLVSSRLRELGIAVPEGRIMLAWALAMGVAVILGLCLRWLGRMLKSA